MTCDDDENDIIIIIIIIIHQSSRKKKIINNKINAKTFGPVLLTLVILIAKMNEVLGVSKWVSGIM